MNEQPFADSTSRASDLSNSSSVFWKASGELALLNTLLIFMFFASAWASTIGNQMLFELQGFRLPVIPMVVLLFIFLSLLSWFIAGKRLKSNGKERFLSAMVGTTPIMTGIVLAALAAVGSIIVGTGNPGAIVLPMMASILAFAASAIFVIVIQVTQ